MPPSAQLKRETSTLIDCACTYYMQPSRLPEQEHLSNSLRGLAVI
jgi:hypothetical protein